MGKQAKPASPLDELRDLCAALVQAEQRVEELEDELDRAKADHKRLRTETIPELMFELQLKEIALQDGPTIKIYPDVQCGITDANKKSAFKWLRDHEFGGLIKTNVKVAFGREDREQAILLGKELNDRFDDSVVLDESVHHSTLKSFVKEQMNQGNEIPHDLFGIFPFNVAKVER